VVARAAEGQNVDGQIQPMPDTSLPAQEQDPLLPLLINAKQYRSYLATDFQSTHSDLTFASYGPAIYALNIPSGGFSFKMQIDLPNGAQISRITIYVVDNNADKNMSFQHYRVKLNNSTQI
jgi:hypothetical protein